MDNRIDVLREEIKQKLSSVGDLAELDKLRVGYLGKKGSITALLKGMKDLTNEERKTFGAEVNKLKANAAAHGIFIMVFDFIALAHRVQTGVDAALRHDRLCAFGLHGRYQI